MVLKAVMPLAREVRVAWLAKPCREAISDRLVLCRGMPPLSRVAMRQWLLEDLRLDADRLAEIDLVAIQACLDCGFKRRQLSCLVVVIERLQQELAPGHPAASGAAGAPDAAGHWPEAEPFNALSLRTLWNDRIAGLDVAAARLDIERFVADPQPLMIWSREYFQQLGERIQVV